MRTLASLPGFWNVGGIISSRTHRAAAAGPDLPNIVWSRVMPAFIIKNLAEVSLCSKLKIAPRTPESMWDAGGPWPCSG
eukprot:2904458-Pyramimonas_sp.AAC.1